MSLSLSLIGFVCQLTPDRYGPVSTGIQHNSRQHELDNFLYQNEGATADGLGSKGSGQDRLGPKLKGQQRHVPQGLDRQGTS